MCFQDWLDFVGFQVRSKKCAPQVSILKRTGKASGYVLKLQETESSRVCFCASTATNVVVLKLRDFQIGSLRKVSVVSRETTFSALKSLRCPQKLSLQAL